MEQPKGNSFTRLDQFASICERQYFLDCLFRRPSTPAMEKGSRLHGITEDMANHCLAEGAWVVPPDLPDADRDYAERLLPLLEVLEPREAETFYKKIKSLWCPGKYDLISETTPYWDEAIGRFTAVEGPCIVDYKFIGRRDRIKSEWEAKKSLQLQMYCLKTGITTAGFVYVLPRGRPALRFVQFTEKDLDKAFKWLDNTQYVIAQRWAALRPDGEGWDEVFSLAAPDQPLCDKRWCDHWERCFGKDA